MFRGLGANINAKDGSSSPFFELIKEFEGGRLFVNAFTPAPDTPRGLACFFSGEYPALNGCDTRYKYPGRFLQLQHGKSSLLKILQDNNFNTVGLFHQPLKTFILPQDFNQNLNCSLELNFSDAINQVKSIADMKSDLVFFVEDIDFHMAVDREKMNPIAGQIGNFKVTNNINKLLNEFPQREKFFDLIIVFSDHGCKFVGDKTDSVHYLDRDRTQILLYILESQTQSNLFIDEEFVSLLDIGRVVLDCAGITYSEWSGRNYNILSKEGADNEMPILIEDYRWIVTNREPHRPIVGAFPDAWIVRDKDRIGFSIDGDIGIFEESALSIMPARQSLAEVEKFRTSCERFLEEHATNYKLIREQFNSIHEMNRYLADLEIGYKDESPFNYHGGKKYRLSRRKR